MTAKSKKNTITFSENIVGVTGGIGSGKSSAVSFWSGRGAGEFIDADRVCSQLLEPGEKGWLALRDRFGNQYFKKDQRLDRQLLRNTIFADGKLRSQVNDVIHPLAREEIYRIVQNISSNKNNVLFFVEVPLLYEAKWEDDFGRVIVVYASPSRCVERIMKRDNVSRNEAEEAIAAQGQLADKALKADHVVDNSGSLFDTFLQLIHLERLLEDLKN